jgi:rod shape determining protein RodA
MTELRRWRDYNWPLLVCVLVLLTIGVLAVYSATLSAVTATGAPLRTIYPGHLINIGIGLILMLLFSFLDYRLLSSLARPLYLGIMAVLTLVLVIGAIEEGAQSWIVIGQRSFQPSEFGKLVLVITLAAYFQRYEANRTNWLIQFGGLVLASIPMLMVLIQPDLGSAIVFITIWMVLAWGADIRPSQIAALLVIAAPIGFIFWQYGLDEFQQTRLLTFYYLLTNPALVDFNDGYNVIQSLNAIEAGGWFGAGLTNGLLSQGNYVPVQHSDFIFAVIGEEMGFAGGLVLIVFQGLLLWQALSIASYAQDMFGRLLALGIFGLIASHVLINVGMNMSLLPVTGLPLPLISHGGSFMITILAAIGLLQSIALHRRKLSF